MDKPTKQLKGAVFIGRSLQGEHPTKPGHSLKVSRIVARHGPNTFETLNSIYEVEFVPKGEMTIPEEWPWPPTKDAAEFIAANKDSGVVSGAAFNGGGGRYTLANGRMFDLTLEDMRSMPMPRWDFNE